MKQQAVGDGIGPARQHRDNSSRAGTANWVFESLRNRSQRRRV